MIQLAPGTIVAGQYRVERLLGVGGMGAVFLARDLRLERTVALKLGTAVTVEGLRRLEREAAALARLSHPNVVVVHQVGEVGGRLFIVMEHVTGGTAREWRAAAPRSWRQILELYLAAGDGLAAAHAAGLVHRDFKPDNVLVGDDGRPRVADFGLARPLGDASPSSGDEAPPSDGGPTRPDARSGSARDLTRTGAVLGTPAYMPPEQLAHGAVDARADQFAFAASLWEALFGARPFAADSIDELEAAIEQGPPRTPAGRHRVPGGIAVALRRGLAARPEDRWPTMPALLAALRRARDRRRRALVGAGTALALAAGATALVAATRGDAVDPCTDGQARIAQVWSPARAQALRGVLGPAVAEPVVAQIDAYARRWALGHRDACRATRVDRSQSANLAELDSASGAPGDVSAGRARALEALAVMEEVNGRDSVHLVPVLEIIARAEQRLGDRAAARAQLERALALATLRLGDAHAQTTSLRLALATVRWESGDRRAAYRLVDEVAAAGGADEAVAAWRAARGSR